MNDVTAVADLDPPTTSAARRGALPLLWLLVGVLLVAATVAAVVTRGEERSASDRLAAAPGAVEDAGTFAYEVTIESNLGAGAAVAVTGAADVEAKRSTAELEIAGRPFQMVTDGQTLYVRVPEASRAATGDKAWLKLDAGQVVPGMGGGFGTTNPLESFEQLRKGGADVEDLGEEEVRGTATRHLRTVLDLTDALDAMIASGGAAAAAAEPLRDQLSAVPVDVWLDDEDRIRRQRTTLDLTIPGVGAVEVVTTVEAFAYGEPVRIEVPTADDVAEGGMELLGTLFTS